MTASRCSTASAALDQLDAIAVGVAHEADPRAAGAHAVRRLLGLDPLLRQVGQHVVEGRDRDRDVVVTGSELVGVDAVVVGQLEPVAVARQAHEHVDRLVADRHPAALLEPERLVERDAAVDVADAVAGMDEFHGPERTLRRMIVERSMSPDWLSNTYLVAAEPGGDAFLVDAGGPVEPLLEMADEQGLAVTHVLLTHHHHDHVAELGKVLERWPDAAVLAHAEERVPGTTGEMKPG